MEQHTQPNSSNATSGIIGISFLLAVALLTYVIRIYTRVRPVYKLSTSDYLVTIALACELATLSLLFATIKLGVSGYDEYITPANRIKIARLFFILGHVAFWASSLARMSIGVMLLNFPVSKAWKITLYILIVIQAVMPFGANIFSLLQCRPIRAQWEPVEGAVCWSTGVSQIYGYVYAGFGTLSDILFASMPVHLFWTLHRPLLERMLGIALMGFGIIATIASLMKIVLISTWNPRVAQFRDWVPLLWWYRVEEIGLIVAACTPFLKPLMERALRGLGAENFGFRTIRLRTVRDEERGRQSESRQTTLLGGTQGTKSSGGVSTTVTQC